MKCFFLIIVLFLIIIIFLNMQVVEGLTVPSVSKHTTVTSGSTRKLTGSGGGKAGRVATSAEYLHHNRPTTATWNNRTGQWNN
jgi:hypothetical protein